MKDELSERSSHVARTQLARSGTECGSGHPAVRVAPTHAGRSQGAASIHARVGPARGDIADTYARGIAHRQADAAAVVRAHHLRIVHAHMRIKHPIGKGEAGIGVAVEERIGREVEGSHGVLRGSFSEHMISNLYGHPS